MSLLDAFGIVSLPPLIRSSAATHLGRLLVAADVHALELAKERAHGFVDGVEAARALIPATIEELYIAVHAAAEARRRELTR